MKTLAAFVSAGALIALTANTAHAAPVCPNGDVATLRTSMLTPTGSMAGLAKAVADHQQWYRAHGYADRILLAPVLTLDRASGGMVASPNQAITFHLRTVEVPKAKHDAGWDAFVAEYKANSTVTNETTVCYPRH
jgi:hypothetical protein